jgi:hypothetical protein
VLQGNHSTVVPDVFMSFSPSLSLFLSLAFSFFLAVARVGLSFLSVGYADSTTYTAPPSAATSANQTALASVDVDDSAAERGRQRQ